jgi:plasmid stabilization system protein ParE
MSSYDELVRAIADEIERYLARHPEAADSVEGISGWWLSSQHGKDAVLAALVQLEARGIVVRMERQGVATIFSSALRGRSTD